MPDTEFPREETRMGKTIKCTLSQKSIQNAIDEIKNYQKSLRSKNEIFIKRLCELGIPVINQNKAIPIRTIILTSKLTVLETMQKPI